MRADVLVAGAGMAGLVAAAHLRERGAEVAVLEKRDRPGGAMALSSGVVWRHRTHALAAEDCPDADPVLRDMVVERLDRDLLWLERLGAPVVARQTGNPRTCGVRFDPQGMTAALCAAAGGVRLGEPLAEVPDRPTVLATGGFAASRPLLRRHVTPWADAVLIRAAPGATGDGLTLGIAAGGSPSRGLGEVYARAMPATRVAPDPADFVALAQLYGAHAEIVNLAGAPFPGSPHWSEIDVAQWMARQPGARARFLVPGSAMVETVGGRAVGEMVEAASSAGAAVIRRPDGGAVVEVVAGITTTLGGLAVDGCARVANGVFAAGQDAGGWATGGYASGLAAALVLGRRAAESALAAADAREVPDQPKKVFAISR